MFINSYLWKLVTLRALRQDIKYIINDMVVLVRQYTKRIEESIFKAQTLSAFSVSSMTVVSVWLISNSYICKNVARKKLN